MEGFGKQVEEFRKHIRRNAADYQVWNLSPILPLHECICLLIGIEPTAKDFRLKNTPYWKIRRIADSNHKAGNLQCLQTGTFMFWPGQHFAIEFIDWAKSIGIEPPEKWQPLNRSSSQSESSENGEGVGDHRRREFIDAAIDMFPKAPNGQKDVINFMREKREQDPDVYQHCLGKQIDDSSLLKSIRNAATGDEPTNPLENHRYLVAKKEYHRKLSK